VFSGQKGDLKVFYKKSEKSLAFVLVSVKIPYMLDRYITNTASKFNKGFWENGQDRVQ